MSRTLSTAQVNHLHRLLGWVRCEIGLSPPEVVSMIAAIDKKALVLDTEYAQAAAVEMHDKAVNVPQYVRDAVTQLSKAIAGAEGEIIDANVHGERHISVSSEQKEKLKKMLNDGNFSSLTVTEGKPPGWLE